MGADLLARHGSFAAATLFSGLLLIATTTALLLLFGRRRWQEREQRLHAELTDVRARLDRAQVFLTADPQIVVAWRSADAEPEIEGDLALVADVPAPRRILGFGTWLPPDSAQALDDAVHRLRSRGEPFVMAVRTRAGRYLDVEGRAMVGWAVLRLRDVSGKNLELTELRGQHAQVLNELGALRRLADAIPDPVWCRDRAGHLTWANTAFLKAVEAGTLDEAVERGTELLDRPTREAAATAREAGAVWRASVPAVVAGARHMLDVIDVPGPTGSAAIAADRSEIAGVRNELTRQGTAYAQILDRLSTGVAIFDRNKRLQFHNAAYRSIWGLSPAFLETLPFDGEILDRLRADGRLPEQADYRRWKAGLLDAYRTVETSEQAWFLPDGRRLRVVSSPTPDGGLTYLFDDATERYQLESKFNSLIRVQGETLDTLREGVGVFGTDGRLTLFNPAFGHMWNLDPARLAERPHINAFAQHCGALSQEPEQLQNLRAVVAALPHERGTFEDRIHRNNGQVFDCIAAPLPDGATLVTFTDATDAVNIARVLTEQNQVLRGVDELRNNFVHHVSYELRSPLTNIIGFAQLLGDSGIGELSPKQREYTGYIQKSSGALLAIINDILDLATIDMDAMELSLGPIDIISTMEEAAKGVQDRLADNKVTLDIVAREGIGSFRADGKRVRQILFNLLSNAIGFSEDGQRVTLAALRRDDSVVFKVSDQGCGIPLDTIDEVFNRFHSNAAGTKHRGVGLGLSIVRSLMELHGGKVLIDSAPNEGTTVTCIFPTREPAIKTAT